MPDALVRAKSLRSLLAQFAAVAFLVMGAALALGKLAVDQVLHRVEQEEAKDNVTRARLALARIARRARQQVEDYAFWDETVRLAQNPEAVGATGFFRRNFVNWLPRNDYEFIELLDRDRQSAFKWSDSTDIRRPAFMTSTALLDLLADSGSVGGYVREGDRLFLVGGAAVRPTASQPGRSPRSGARAYLLIGSDMEGERRRSLESELQLVLRVLPPNFAVPDTSGGAGAPVGTDSVRTFLALPGVDGSDAAVIELRDSRSELRRISRWVLIGALASFLFGAAAFVLVWLYGRRLVITPLRAIAFEMETMHRRGELAEVSSAPPSAEWALFLRTFNETVRSFRESELRYRALFDQGADPYFLLDAETRTVVDANPAASALTGVAPTELLNRALPEHLSASPGPGGTIHVRRPDGPMQTWGVVETEITLGERRLVLAAYRDLTDREALAQSQKMEAVGSLAGGIAHDFNNLMGSVLAGVRVARGAVRNDQRGTSALDAIEHAGRRAAELTKRLLGVSRQEPLVRVPVDVGAAMGNVEHMCRSTFHRRIRLEFSAPANLPSIEGDPGQLEQALLNLCINARDAMPDGGTLRVAGREADVDDATALTLRDIRPGRYVVLSVTDDGAGMTDDVKQRIFEPFFTTKPRDKGSGLGLSMVYGLARSSGGTIVVESAPGAGARFDLYLPASAVAAAAADRRPAPAPSAPSVRAERPVVLLADDETGLREVLRMVLEHEGYDVVEASNGEEALARLAERRNEIAVVLLDVQMPVLGGLDAYGRLQEIAPHVPVILGTGYVGDAELGALRSVGAEDLLTKPYDIPELLERLSRVVAVRA